MKFQDYIKIIEKHLIIPPANTPAVINDWLVGSGKVTPDLGKSCCVKALAEEGSYLMTATMDVIDGSLLFLYKSVFAEAVAKEMEKVSSGQEQCVEKEIDIQTSFLIEYLKVTSVGIAKYLSCVATNDNDVFGMGHTFKYAFKFFFNNILDGISGKKCFHQPIQEIGAGFSLGMGNFLGYKIGDILANHLSKFPTEDAVKALVKKAVGDYMTPVVVEAITEVVNENYLENGCKTQYCGAEIYMGAKIGLAIILSDMYLKESVEINKICSTELQEEESMGQALNVGSNSCLVEVES